MLKELREKSKSWIVKTLFILIVVTFVSWGGYTNIKGCGKNVALKIGKKIVYRDEFEQMAAQRLAQTRNFYKMLYKMDLPKIQEATIRQYVVEDLITKEIMSQKAENANITVSSEEVKADIINSEIFKDKETGEFNYDNYKRILSYHFGKTPAGFESDKRNELVLKRLENVVRGLAKVTEFEINKAYRFENEKVNLEYFKIEPDKLKKDIKISEDKVKAYFEKNKNLFKTEEKRKLAYLSLYAGDYLNEVQLDEDKLVNYFEANFFEDKDPTLKEKRYHINYIEFKFNKDEKEKIHKKAKEAFNKIKTSKSFGKFAREYGTSNGDMGYITKTRFQKNLSDRIFKLKKGDLKLLQVGNGYHIVEIIDAISPGEVNFERLQPEVAYKYKIQEATELARKDTDKIQKEIAKNLSDYAKKNNIEFSSTDFLNKKELRKTFGFTITKEILKLNKDAISNALFDKYSKKGEFYLVQVLDILEPKTPPFNDVKKEVKEKYKKEESKNYAKNVSEDILKALKDGTAKKEIATKYNIKLEETGLFARTPNNYVPKVGSNNDITKLAFSAKAIDPLVKQTFKIGNDFYVFMVKEKQEIKQEEFESKKEETKEKLVKDKNNIIFEGWKDYLKSKIEIKKYI